MPQAIVEMLGDDSKLGRLEVSVVDGLDASGKIKDVYAYGGRSVSIYRYVDVYGWMSKIFSRFY